MGKYEDALERAKELHEAGNALTKSQMEIVFPELKESEDERIREALVNLIVADINELIKSADSRAYFQGVKEYLEDVRQFAYNKGIVDAMEKQKDKVVKFDHDRELKPAEWSEEDKTIIEGACNALEIHGHSKLADKLKSLRPQSHWKPSEEQMRYLLAVINEPNNAGSESCHLVLKGLYEQLKKLM